MAFPTIASFPAALRAAHLLYVDLEVNPQTTTIFRAGLLSTQHALDAHGETLDDTFDLLAAYHRARYVLCGHHFRRFDYPHLLKRAPLLTPWPIVDTLELSLLADPLQRSHRLNKDYKRSEFARNNPLEDARATQDLLAATLDTIFHQPEALWTTYFWLLTCGTSEADDAYRALYHTMLGLPPLSAPTITDLPPDACDQMDAAALQHFVTSAPQFSFDQRLCGAALLAWNYERRQTDSLVAYPSWLLHQPDFAAVLQTLRPLRTSPFTFADALYAFHVPAFRPPQEDAVRHILAATNPILLMPTGGGKSLCYQIPAWLLSERHRSLTVVISPLQALMDDQVLDLEQMGHHFATALHGNLPQEVRAERLQQVFAGRKRLLYISPEQLRSPSVRALFTECPPALWVIDEAHCISQWGNDFRPDYAYIPKYIRELAETVQQPLPRLALVTATATAGVLTDIRTLFTQQGIPLGPIIQAPTMQRPNLTYRVLPVAGNRTSLVRAALIEAVPDHGSAIVYVTTRKTAEAVAKHLRQTLPEGMTCRCYHGKLKRDEKDEVLRHFKSGAVRIVVATSAFGMGINRADVRVVMHYNMSQNLENYLQESGRAGRDGQPAQCVLLFDPADDAERIFDLQGRSQLKEEELRTMFHALRTQRDRAPAATRNDGFFITAHDIATESHLDDEDFAYDLEQRDTKIKTALHLLERFGLIERAENMTSVIQFRLLSLDEDASQAIFQRFAHETNISLAQQQQFAYLITALYTLTDLAAHEASADDMTYALERLCTLSHIDEKAIRRYLKTLVTIGVCTFTLPITVIVTKGVKGDARNKLERISTLEAQLWQTIAALLDEQATDAVGLDLALLARQIDPDGAQHVNAATLRDILTGWADRTWLRITKRRYNTVRLSQITVQDHIEQHLRVTQAILATLYQHVEQHGITVGARLRIAFDLQAWTLAVQTQLAPEVIEDASITPELLWLHHREVVRLSDGLQLFQQAMKLRVIAGGRIDTITRRYPEVAAFAAQQHWRTQALIVYGNLATAAERATFVEAYFQLPQEMFRQAYPFLATAAASLPLLAVDELRILGDLNAQQQAIVLATNPAILVIAGPGSGKTRTIVHRVAYLVKAQRVDPARILMLAFNRNAVRELRLRLERLLGSYARYVRVLTFHGLALALLGRGLSSQTSHPTTKTEGAMFDTLITDACRLLADDEDESQEDLQARRRKLLGHIEHIIVDEYQDVDQSMYALLRLLSGLHEAVDETRAVTTNLCVIGDDDQAINNFRGADVTYIQQYTTEYHATRYLLTENYRSQPPIIAASNALIHHNRNRCKALPEEQVRSPSTSRVGDVLPVIAYQMDTHMDQVIWIIERLQAWRAAGVSLAEIAILACNWEDLSLIRLLLARNRIPAVEMRTSHDGADRRNCAVTKHLIAHLQQTAYYETEQAVEVLFRTLFDEWGHHETEPTVQALLALAQDLDRERGIDQDHAVPTLSLDPVAISYAEICDALGEGGQRNDPLRPTGSVVLTSYHSAKGLEFERIILLDSQHARKSANNEEERRLFYVGLTRAKQEACICFIGEPSVSVRETQAQVVHVLTTGQPFPQQYYYHECIYKDMYLDRPTLERYQAAIQQVREGDELRLEPYVYNHAPLWRMTTSEGKPVGSFSHDFTQALRKEGFTSGQFQFQPGEVTVSSVSAYPYKQDASTKEHHDTYVVLPTFSLYRE